MKSFLLILLLAGFLGVAVFGGFNLGHVSDHESGCIAAQAQGMDCPKKMDLINFAAFHLESFKTFFLASSKEILSALLLLLLFIAGAVIGRTLASLAPPHLRLTSFRFRYRTFFVPSRELEFVRWLALHENSPSRS